MVIEQALGSNLDQSNTNLGFLNYLIGKMQYFIKLFSGINRIMHVKNLAHTQAQLSMSIMFQREFDVIVEYMNGTLQSYLEEFQEGRKDQQNQNC